MRGLLAHATGKERVIEGDDGSKMTMRSHMPPPTLGNAVLAAVKA